jgi:hypothetical protein
LFGYFERINTATVTASTFTANLAGNNIFDLTLQNANVAITFINAPDSGNAFPITLVLRQPSTAANVVNYSNTVYWSNAEVPTLASGIANKLDIVSILTFNGGSTYFGAHSMANVSY